jgi:hypothetical protein
MTDVVTHSPRTHACFQGTATAHRLKAVDLVALRVVSLAAAALRTCRGIENRGREPHALTVEIRRAISWRPSAA